MLKEGKLVSTFSSDYTPEQRLEIVEEARRKGIKVAAKERGIPPTTISTWKRRLEKQAKKIGGLPWRTLMVQHLEGEKGRLNKEMQRIEAERENLSIKIVEHQETIEAIDRVLKLERESESPRDIPRDQSALAPKRALRIFSTAETLSARSSTFCSRAPMCRASFLLWR